MLIRFAHFALLFVPAAAGMFVLGTYIVSFVIDPPRMLRPSHVSPWVFAATAPPLFLAAYPLHRFYVIERRDWSVGNLLRYLGVNLALQTGAFALYAVALARGHASALQALIPYALLVLVLLWIGGLWSLRS